MIAALQQKYNYNAFSIPLVFKHLIVVQCSERVARLLTATISNLTYFNGRKPSEICSADFGEN